MAIAKTVDFSSYNLAQKKWKVRVQEMPQKQECWTWVFFFPKQESEHASNYACDTQNLFYGGGR